MSSLPVGGRQWARRRNLVPTERFATSKRLRIGALVLRAVFIGLVLVMTVHASLPENSNFWNIYETPSDLIRLLLGIAVCVWVTIQLFVIPKDDHALQTWFFLGLAGVPFILICIVGTW
jgi:archaellum biogenesis protein FlaJ (TadC family)